MNQFVKLAEVQIFFFKNGLIVKGFPFKPYHSKEAQVTSFHFRVSFPTF